jgi:hypothetical protein
VYMTTRPSAAISKAEEISGQRDGFASGGDNGDLRINLF